MLEKIRQALGLGGATPAGATHLVDGTKLTRPDPNQHFAEAFDHAIARLRVDEGDDAKSCAAYAAHVATMATYAADVPATGGEAARADRLASAFVLACTGPVAAQALHRAGRAQDRDVADIVAGGLNRLFPDLDKLTRMRAWRPANALFQAHKNAETKAGHAANGIGNLVVAHILTGDDNYLRAMGELVSSAHDDGTFTEPA